MKLVRYGSAGEEKPGLVMADGTLKDLSAHLDDISGEILSKGSLDRIGRLDPASLETVSGSVRFGPCVTKVGKFLAIGLNYRDHAAEIGKPIPKEPEVFMKATTSICGPDDRTLRPRGSTKLDYELELGIIIGAKAQYVSEAAALQYIAGYCVVNDVSERNYQFERGTQWDKGKSADSFGPIGPWLVTPDEVGNPQDLNMWLSVNGSRRQTGTTSRMIFSCAQIVSYLSAFMTLLPGDIVTTGTPPGVGHGRKPPEYLNDGDVIELGIDKLGSQQQVVKSNAD